MQVKSFDLGRALSKSAFAPVYVLIGSDFFSFNESIQQIKHHWLLAHPDTEIQAFAISHVDDWQQLLAAANNYSLFSDSQLLDVSFDKKSLDTAGKNALNLYVSNKDTQKLVLIRAPLLTTKQLTHFIGLSDVCVVTHVPLTKPALQAWIKQQLRAAQLEFETSITELILNATEGNQLASAQVIEKLALIKEPGDTISIAEVSAQLSEQANYQFNELSDVLLQGHLEQCLRILRQAKADRIEITLVAWVVTQEIRRLIQLHQQHSQGFSLDDACKKGNIWPKKIPLYRTALKRIPQPTLYDALKLSQTLDQGFKSGQLNNPWESLEQLILKLT
jgi:DNA polymerase-3 subunit delta